MDLLGAHFGAPPGRRKDFSMTPKLILVSAGLGMPCDLEKARRAHVLSSASSSFAPSPDKRHKMKERADLSENSNELAAQSECIVSCTTDGLQAVGAGSNL